MLKVTEKVRLFVPASPSDIDTSFIVKLDESSFRIVPVPVFPATGVEISLPGAVGCCNTTEKFSCGSTMSSPFTSMVMVFVAPLNESASENETLEPPPAKSEGAFEVPLDV